MRDASAFEGTAHLGLARTMKRDSHRLELLGKHLEPDEEPLVLLPVHRSTLVVTDRRLLELRPHLEIAGAWNVRRFEGFEVGRTVDRASISDVVHQVSDPWPESGDREERLVLSTPAGPWGILVTRGPRPVLSPEDLRDLRSAILGPQPM